jgi:hypothetical protein
MRTVITPERAAEIMDQNIINRRINQANVGFLVDQINSEQFVFNGESIIISNEGHLLDGQHRLMACIKANKPIEVNLVEGVPFEAMSTIDQGRSRTAGDVLGMNGAMNANNLASIAKRIITKFGQDVKRGSAPQGSRNKSILKVSNTEILEFVHRKGELIKALTEFSIHLYNTGTKIVSAAQIGAYIYLFSYEDDTDGTKAINFFREVMYGSNMGKTSNIAMKLRNRLIDEKISSKTSTEAAKRSMIIKAWRLYKEDEVRKTFVAKEKETLIFSGDDVWANNPNLDVNFMKKFLV